MPNMPNMPELFGAMMNNQNIKNIAKNPKFQEKFLQNQSNPVELMKDPEVQEVVKELWDNVFNQSKK